MILTALLAAATAKDCDLWPYGEGNYRHCFNNNNNKDISTADKVNGETLCAPYASGYPCCIASFHTTYNNLDYRRCYPVDILSQACEENSISIDIVDGYTNYVTKCDGNQNASLTPASPAWP